MEVLLRHGRARYMDRVEQLAWFGPKLSNGVDMLETALKQNNVDDASICVQEIIADIIDPVTTIFEDMEKDIPLEKEGACIIIEHWPVERLDKVYSFLQKEASLPIEFLFFVQGLEVGCAPLINPTPFHHPLDSKPVLNVEPYPVDAGEAQPSFMPSHFTEANNVPTGAAVDPVPAENDSKNIACRADFTNTLQATQGGQQKSSSKTSGSSSIEKDVVFSYMTSTLFEFQMSVQDLMKGDSLSTSARNDVSTILQKLMDCGHGKKQLLEEGEAALYKAEVQRIQRRIANLANSVKKPIKTRELDTLAHNVMKLWSSAV